MRRAWLVALAALCLWPWAERPLPAGSLVERLLGPFASLAASVEWVRFDSAWSEGRAERAYAHAERALALDPRSPQGWLYLAAHLVYERGSALHALGPGERARWIRAGIELLARGEARTNEPAQLAFAAGLAWDWVARNVEAGELEWPDGARRATERALACLERADRLGHPAAERVARALREELAR